MVLQDLDTKFKIFQCFVVDEYTKPTFLPRVHAELVVLDHFHTQELVFAEGDKYIGCSKQACCCYHYICAHPGKFVHPASHNKTGTLLMSLMLTQMDQRLSATETS